MDGWSLRSQGFVTVNQFSQPLGKDVLYLIISISFERRKRIKERYGEGMAV